MTLCTAITNARRHAKTLQVFIEKTMKSIIPLFFVLLSVGGYWLFWINQQNQAQYSGFIEAEDASVGSKISGRVVHVAVQEGDRVKQGDLLVTLDSDSLSARLKEAEAGLKIAEKRLEELRNGSRPQEIEQMQALHEQARQEWILLQNGPRVEDIRAAEANVASASADLALASITEKRRRELFAKKDTTAENLDRAVQELSVAQNRLNASLAELDKLRAGFRIEEIQAAEAKTAAASASLSLTLEGPRQEEIDRARAEVERAKALLKQAQIDLDETTIAAPSDAVVEVSRLQPGDLLPARQTAVNLILLHPLWVRIYIPESRLGSVSIGTELPATVAAYPGKTFSGRIVQINRQAEFTPRNVQTPETRDDLVFGVKIELDDPEQLLRPGMVADVDIPLPAPDSED
ncbi:MAG: efflux RND transporter periplasmic adaptor subunit [Candidatus Omnitrophica bacterium]|nr:efflux RND transporter periplasmic adaptor subunit [Candidatus Omnitrophota bacterium]